MKIVIRKGMFETNSSSTHVCILFKDNKEYQDFIDGKLWFGYFGNLLNMTLKPFDEIEIEGIKCAEIFEDLNNMSHKAFHEKYKDIIPDDEVDDEESFKWYLKYYYGYYSFDILHEEYEENLTEREGIKALCYTGWDG